MRARACACACPCAACNRGVGKLLRVGRRGRALLLAACSMHPGSASALGGRGCKMMAAVRRLQFAPPTAGVQALSALVLPHTRAGACMGPAGADALPRKGQGHSHNGHGYLIPSAGPALMRPPRPLRHVLSLPPCRPLALSVSDRRGSGPVRHCGAQPAQVGANGPRPALQGAWGAGPHAHVAAGGG